MKLLLGAKLTLVNIVLSIADGAAACLGGRDKFCRCDPLRYRVACTGMDLDIDEVLPFLIPARTRTLALRKNWVLGDVTLRPEHLSRLVGLTHFDISKNRLSNIESGTFSEFPQLTSIDLSDNRLRVLETDVFVASLPQMTRLNLAANRIVVLLGGTFQALDSLTHLDLRWNPILYISPEAFSGLGQLTSLQLSDCNLTSFPSPSLAPLANLRHLVLRGFPFVREIPEDAFRYNGELVSLVVDRFPSLSSSVLSPHVFASVPCLSSLTLSYCNLTRVPVESIGTLKKIIYLDLSGNQLESVTANDFVKMERLERISLSNTGLLDIDDLTFRRVTRLKSLDISNNRLTSLKRSAFPRNISQLRNVTMEDNMWSCDCRIQWIASLRSVSLGRGTSFCAFPKYTQGKSLRQFALTLAANGPQCVPPKIKLFNPTNISDVMPGSDVSLSCSASGSPLPIITWYTPNGYTFPEMQPSRVRHELPSNQLRIRSFRARDAGEYRCVATNSAGDDMRAVRLRMATPGDQKDEKRREKGDGQDPLPESSSVNATNECERETGMSPLLRIVLMGVLGVLACLGLVSSFVLALWGHSNRRARLRLQLKVDELRSAEHLAAGAMAARAKFADKRVTFGQSLSSGYGSVQGSPNGHLRPPSEKATPDRGKR